MNEDMADIQAFMQAAGVAAVAEACRQQTGQLELAPPGYQSTSDYFQSRGMTRVVPQQESRSEPLYTQAYPMTRRPGFRERMRNAGPLEWTFAGVLLALAGLLIWAIIAIATAVIAALGMLAAALVAALPLLVVGALLMLLVGGRGGGGKSFTFSGSGRIL